MSASDISVPVWTYPSLGFALLRNPLNNGWIRVDLDDLDDLGDGETDLT